MHHGHPSAADAAHPSTDRSGRGPTQRPVRRFRMAALALGIVLGVVALVALPAADAKPPAGKGKSKRSVVSSTTTTTASTSTTTPSTTTPSTSTSTTSTTSVPVIKSDAPTTTSTSGSAAAAATPSGEPMPVGNLSGWKQIFTDDFTTDVPLGQFPGAVSDKWGAYPDGWKDTMKHGTYAPSKVLSVQNGVLDFHLRTENGVPLVSAPYPKLPTQTVMQYGQPFTPQLYGRYAVRFRADSLDRYKVAWLLWPMSDIWPRDGEIDFPEGDLPRTIEAFMHKQGATSGSDQDAFFSTAGFGSWHTAVIEWLPDRVTFILDGKVLGTSTDRIPNTPMRWTLQTETALVPQPPDASIAGHVQVDWVAVWARA